MRSHARSLSRLLGIQANWNYERMIGVGMAWSAGPILAELIQRDRARHMEAVARSAEFFNCNPNLAGLAVGALSRAELDGVPGPQVLRLRTALSGPLGALGDRLFWAGLVPFLSGLALACVALGAGLWAVAVLLVTYNVIRAGVTWWALRTGLREGMQVGAAVGRSWLPRAADAIAAPAGFAVGAALPLSSAWLLKGQEPRMLLIVLAVALVGLVVQRAAGGWVTSVRYTAALLAVVAITARFLT
jgi:mannose/fructose/N-acetylgalactosamine-specific phosphotransferase system component IID